MENIEPYEIRVQPLARWFHGCLLFPISAYLIVLSIQLFNRNSYLLSLGILLSSLMVAFYTLKVITTKIFLSADSIEVESLVLSKVTIFKKDIRSKKFYQTGSGGGHGVIIYPIDLKSSEIDINLALLSSKNTNLIYKFLQDVQAEHMKK